MKELDLDDVCLFVNEHIVGFHQNRINSLEKLTLDNLLRKKNPYLFKAKHITTALSTASATRWVVLTGRGWWPSTAATTI